MSYFAPQIAGDTVVWFRGIFITGSSLLGAAIRVPRITSKNLIRQGPDYDDHLPMYAGRSAITVRLTCGVSCSIIFCEAVAIYGVIVAIILQTKIDYVDKDATTGLYPIPAMTSGYAIFGSGITTGWANLACG
jgi:V-type H+-transporting ATPase proteolipid subunit